MTSFNSDYQQTIAEKTTYTVDYTALLPTGGTITGGTATHTPPSGTASVPAVQVASPYLYVTFQPAVLGRHYLDVLATFSDNDKANVRLAVHVIYPDAVARVGMSDLVTQVREMCDLGVNDYSIGGVPYWNDAQIQAALDRHAWTYVYYELEPQWMKGSGGTLESYDYYLPAQEWEQAGTVDPNVFYLQDAAGATVLSSLYSVDYAAGVISFTANTAGAVYYVNGSAYDLKGAASEIWQKKAGHYASAYNFSTDNHSVSRETLMSHCMDMSSFYAAQGDEGAGSTDMVRDDTNT
jgi:hypothetical protein